MGGGGRKGGNPSHLSGDEELKVCPIRFHAVSERQLELEFHQRHIVEHLFALLSICL